MPGVRGARRAFAAADTGATAGAWGPVEAAAAAVVTVVAGPVGSGGNPAPSLNNRPRS